MVPAPIDPHIPHLADRLERGLRSLIDRLVTADHHLERSVHGARHATAHRSVEHVDAALLEDAVELPHHGGRAR
jgi:hypothetical protein